MKPPRGPEQQNSAEGPETGAQQESWGVCVWGGGGGGSTFQPHDRGGPFRLWVGRRTWGPETEGQGRGPGWARGHWRQRVGTAHSRGWRRGRLRDRARRWGQGEKRRKQQWGLGGAAREVGGKPGGFGVPEPKDRATGGSGVAPGTNGMKAEAGRWVRRRGLGKRQRTVARQCWLSDSDCGLPERCQKQGECRAPEATSGPTVMVF